MEDTFESAMTPEDRIVLSLRRLYGSFGFKKFKVSKFEEYDLYLQNKNFLTTENLITFNDMRGRLLALKPDITLSIVKDSEATEQNAEKFYYIENVYRVSPRSHDFQEIPQMGLELIGGSCGYTTLETTALAVRTLQTVSDKFVLNVSHMGLVRGLLDATGASDETKKRLLDCLRRKSLHGVRELAARAGVKQEDCEALCKLVRLYGDFAPTLQACRTLCRNNRTKAAADALQELYAGLEAVGLEKQVRLDFSIVNDLDYYNGVIFQGFVEGLPRAVLSGGRYDNLLKKFGRDVGAIGFALYMDELERYRRPARDLDIDALVLYDADADKAKLFRCIDQMTRRGLSVRAEQQAPLELRVGKTYRFDGETVKEVEQNA